MGIKELAQYLEITCSGMNCGVGIKESKERPDLDKGIVTGLFWGHEKKICSRFLTTLKFQLEKHLCAPPEPLGAIGGIPL